MKSRTMPLLILALAIFSLTTTACIPPEASAEELATIEIARKDSVRNANKKDCMKHLSFATDYYRNREYADALNNYKKLFKYECVDGEIAQNVYAYIANCYRELENLDSALIYYNEGLMVIPEDEYLWDSKLHTLGLMGDEEAILQTKVEKYALFPEKADLGEEIVELHIAMGKYEEARSLIETLMIEDPDNKNLQNMRYQCEEALGGDIRSLVEAEYEKNPGNLSSAQLLVGLLREADENTEAIKVLEGMLEIIPESTSIIKELVELLSMDGQTKKVLSHIERLHKISPENINIQFDLTAAYIMDGDFKSAMSWANKALGQDKTNGQAYSNRASVYEAVATNCLASPPDFDDKLVFLMAFEDYQTAKAKGYHKITGKIEFLKEARIPKSSDWFFNRDDYVKAGQAKPQKECYTWLNRSVDAPKN